MTSIHDAVLASLKEGRPMDLQVRLSGGLWVDAAYVEGRVRPKTTQGATFRMALLRYKVEPNNQGYTCYVTCVTDPKSEVQMEARDNFVQWLGDRVVVKA